MNLLRRTTIIALLAALCPALLVMAAGGRPDEAFGLFNTGDYQGASRALAREVSARPGDLGLRLSYAVCLLQSRQYGQAVTELTAVKRAAPGLDIADRLMEQAERGRMLPAKPGVVIKVAPLRVVTLQKGAITQQTAVTEQSQAILLREAERHPESAPLANLLADALQLQGKGAEAEKWYRRAAGIAPAWTKPLVGLAINVLDTDPTRAANLLQDVLRREPGNGQARLWLGDAYTRLGRPDDAQREYIQAMRIPEVEPDARVRMGNIFLRGKQTAQALQQFKQATAADPSNVGAAVGQAQVYSLNQQQPQAAAALKQASPAAGALMPQTRAGVLINSAQVQASAGEIAPSIQSLRDATALAPGMQQAYAQMAETFSRQGTLRAQIEANATRLRRNPADLPALRFLAEGYRVSGQTDRLSGVLTELARQDQQDRWSWEMRLAEVLWQQGKQNQAAAKWLDAVDVGYPVRTVRIAQSVTGLPDAPGFVCAALRTSGSSSAPQARRRAAQHLLYAILREQGHPAEALDCLNAVIRADADNPTLYGQRGDLLSAMGRQEEAAADYRRQRELTPLPAGRSKPIK